MAVDHTPLSDPVRCVVTPALLPQVNMSASIGTPMKFTSLGANDDLVLLLAPDSPLYAMMGRRTLDIPSRGISLGDAAIKGAFVSQLQEGGFKTALLNRKALLTFCPDAEDRVAQPLEHNSGLTTLFYRYYDFAIKLAPSLDALAQNAVSQHLMDLAVLLVGSRKDAEEVAKGRGLAAARLEAIKAEILASLGEGNLSLTVLAQRQRTSTRYIQMLFERDGMTFSEFVLEQRLLRAARLLRDPLHRMRKVSDVAFLAGFNDVSYFHRMFRRRFGMTPRDMRDGLGPFPDETRQ
jgi:AraC-like DNA-binding protein